MECSVCFEPYTAGGERDPHILSCGHTFCLSCLKQLSSYCPECREPNLQNVEDLPRNIDLIRSFQDSEGTTKTPESSAPSILHSLKLDELDDDALEAQQKAIAIEMFRRENEKQTRIQLDINDRIERGNQISIRVTEVTERLREVNSKSMELSEQLSALQSQRIDLENESQLLAAEGAQIESDLTQLRDQIAQEGSHLPSSKNTEHLPLPPSLPSSLSPEILGKMKTEPNTSSWDASKAPDMCEMLYGATDFKQDVNWRVSKLRRTNEDILEAVNAWCENEGAAEAKYGLISNWDTSSVKLEKDLSNEEKEDPLHIKFYAHSFDVMNCEMEETKILLKAQKAAGETQESVLNTERRITVFKSHIESLEALVNSGELDLDSYIKRLRCRAEQDATLVKYLIHCRRQITALKVMRRMNVAKQEILFGLEAKALSP